MRLSVPGGRRLLSKVEGSHSAPVVTPVGPFFPDFEAVGDSFAPQLFADMPVASEEGILFPDDEDHIHVAKLSEGFLTFQIGKEVARGVKVDVLVVVAVEEITEPFEGFR